MKYYIINDGDNTKYVFAEGLLSAISLIVERHNPKTYSVNISVLAGILFTYLNVDDHVIQIVEKDISQLPCWIE